jgi:hypothetical protein
MTPRPPAVIGVDAGTTGLRDADHLVRELAAEVDLPEDGFGCTHLTRADGRPRITVSFTVTAPEAAERLARLSRYAGSGAARAAAAEARARTAGRAVLFPGVRDLADQVTVGELLAGTAIEEVTVLGSPGTPDAGQRLVTRGHIRPEWRGGRLVLAAMPAAGGVLAPFEVPDPTPCCADHGAPHHAAGQETARGTRP